MDLNVYGVAVIPVVLSLVELAKRLGVPTYWAPLVSLAFGMLFGFVFVAPGDPKKAVYAGLVIGCAAVGLYSGTKNTLRR